MSLLNFPVYDCDNESDVEQKLIYPLLTHPSFLDIPSRAVITKRSLASFSFTQKSSLPKNYIPDFIIFNSGFPVCVIEAKGPDIAVEKAIGEARLYAQVLNANFPTGTNPVLLAVGCNGKELAVGPWDSNEYQTFSVNDLLVGTDRLAAIKRVMGSEPLSEHAAGIQRKMSRARYVTAARSLEAGLFLERITPNSLAPYLNQVYEMFFRAEDPEKIQLIGD